MSEPMRGVHTFAPRPVDAADVTCEPAWQPEQTPCPPWCDNVDHHEGQGVDHVGASATVAGTVGEGRAAQTYAYREGDAAWVYVSDLDLTPVQAREYAAAVVRAAELAERIGA